MSSAVAVHTHVFTGYALSLLICFVALFLMNYAQPALLYIVPCTLIPIALLAYFRGELKELWLGDTPPDPVGPASPSRSEDRKGSTVDEETGESPEVSQALYMCQLCFLNKMATLTGSRWSRSQWKHRRRHHDSNCQEVKR